jgi:hypothetical protein
VRRHDRETFDAEAQPLMRTLSHALHAGHPLTLLDAISGLLAATEPRRSLQDEPPAVDLDALVETFEGTDLAATTAALHVISVLTADDILRARIRRTLDARTHPMPAWLPRLAQTEVRRVIEMRHIQRDGEDFFFDVRLPDGFAMTAMVYVDNNMGQVVNDAFVMDRPVDTVLDRIRLDVDVDTTLEPTDAAAARARIDQALFVESIMFPPIETDTWPLCRPLVRWLVGLLPVGGEMPDAPEWSDDELGEIAEDFLASRFGIGLDDEAHRELLEELLWLGAEYDIGDPLRWSPVNIEMLLVDRAPRKIVADAQRLAKLPQLLRAFVRYAHHERGLRRELTSEALAAVDRWEPEYQRLIRTDRPQGADALLQMMLEARGESLDGRAPRVLPDLDVAAVGGREALEQLDADPLPDEPFDWTGVEDDIKEKVSEVLALCDRNADELLDLEHQTANRRLLRDLAAANPAFFRGRAAARTSAAAISYMVAHANRSLSSYGPLTAQALIGHFGVKSASQRAHQFRDFLGLPEHLPDHGPMPLGSPDYLVGIRRQELIDNQRRKACGRPQSSQGGVSPIFL